MIFCHIIVFELRWPLRCS